MSGAYYNEIDPYAAQWLRNLIAAGHIAAGDVDERSIEDVIPNEIRGYTQHHFFAGIGIWSLALRRAGWADDRAVITGSCPCQPFSAAGKGAGFADERHLWPAFFHIIQALKPKRVYGEQVASLDGLGWSDLVQTDLEGAGYTWGGVDLCAAGVGAPHIRQRLYWVADADHNRLNTPPSDGLYNKQHYIESRSGIIGMADSDHEGLQGHWRPKQEHDAQGRQEPIGHSWAGSVWIECRDGKYRPIEPSIKPLANGDSSRVGRLRAYGNAICVDAAQAVIQSTM